MKSKNRGNVPAPHVPPGAGKAFVDPSEQVVFDAGELSFVQNWVEGVDGVQEPVEQEVERGVGRQSGQNRRLGVGAVPKMSHLEKVEPTALEKKLLRKRQRQEQSDALANELGAHGVADSDDDGEGDSKTASFKGKKRGRNDGNKKSAENDDTNPIISKATRKKKAKGSKAENEARLVAVSGTDTHRTHNANEGTDLNDEAASNSTIQKYASTGDDIIAALHAEHREGTEPENSKGKKDAVRDESGEKRGRKRKARRKNKSSKATANPENAGNTESVTKTNASSPSPAGREGEPAGTDKQTPGDAATQKEGDGLGINKQRRGWGKGRSSTSTAPLATSNGHSSLTTEATHNAVASKPKDPSTGEDQDASALTHRRKKTRSKQKNIRKDNRPMDRRPSHLRPGDPGYMGRGLTDETRKVLGLPQDSDNVAPPAGWRKSGEADGKPKKNQGRRRMRENKPGWVIDKTPDPMSILPKQGVAHENAFGRGVVDEGVTVEVKSKKVSAALAAVDKRPRKTDKYKNLAI